MSAIPRFCYPSPFSSLLLAGTTTRGLMKRRDFLSGVAVTSASLIGGAGARANASALSGSAVSNEAQAKPTTGGRPRNIMISAANGITSRGNHLQAEYEKLIAGADTLEAAIT